MDIITNQILCDLKKNHLGKSEAIHSIDLENRYEISGRALRRRINKLRRDGVPICSISEGYYYAKEQRDMDGTVKYMDQFLTGLSKARFGLLASKVLPVPNCKIRIVIRS